MTDLKESTKTLTGTIKTTGKGMGFVAIEGFEEDIVIEPDFVNHALNGDTVEIIFAGKYIDAKRSRKQSTQSQELKPERQAGQVVKIIERAKTQFVGLVEKHEGKLWIKPDDKKMYVDILVEKGEAKEGDKVLIHLAHWNSNERFPAGDIIQVLGRQGEHETEMQSIILDRGIDTHFPEAVDAEANELEKTEKPLKQEEIAQRRDVRGTLTFTIDPVDAKDFDDAISYKELGNDLFEIGVHIADVSYYVRQGSELDREAIKRATSVYLVDRTIPMLPEVLSNDLCSLNAHEDKFAFSAIFTLNKEGQVQERWFGRTVINSNKRFTYETAQESINDPTGEFHAELDALNKIAKKIQQDNYKKGAINFDQVEVKFKLDAAGKPIAVYKKEPLDTHKLVEAFMLLANREVAEFIYNSQKNSTTSASLYRIHDVPDAERIEGLALFLKALGFNLPVKQGKVSSQDINVLLKSVEGKPEENLIKTATIRSMAKAIYSPKNIGHFGLAFKFYTHFTSPIRRYPDLVVHRVLENILKGNKKKIDDEFSFLDKIAAHSTEKEIAAAEAERASIKYKQVEYMSQFIGQEFDGVISGVTEWGIYVEELNTKCEGMIPLRELGNDYFVFNKKTYSVEGEKTKTKFRLGDKVRFRVVKADLEAKTLDYKLV